MKTWNIGDDIHSELLPFIFTDTNNEKYFKSAAMAYVGDIRSCIFNHLDLLDQ